ncbi:hypothetical protein ACKLNO_01105 [Neisseriaceae bacterium B1]
MHNIFVECVAQATHVFSMIRETRACVPHTPYAFNIIFRQPET